MKSLWKAACFRAISNLPRRANGGNTIENVTNDINKVDFLKSELNPVEDEEFSPDKLRSNIERLYMTVIVGLMNLWKHIVRLRSWREQRRTAAFCVTYFAAWLLDIVVPMLSS
ncbi:hypothetical protein EYB25_001589 [Talaromyces marneffei]|nr:hypothetical protein EYB25_001589 [Talaromyces marneffei]